MPEILEEFEQMFKEYHYQVDIWGGRGGARSHHLTLHALNQLMYNENFRGFFIREVHSTIYSSLWADFKDRVEELEDEGFNFEHFTITDNSKGENYARNNITGAVITTKGFQASNKQHTANLKSLAGASHIYIEEAEETLKSNFNKLALSVRKKGVKIQLIRAFNPPPKEHWIWQDYDLTKLSNEDLYNIICKVSNDDPKIIKGLTDKNKIEFLTAKPKDDRLFIQTNYYNNFAHLNEKVINVIEENKHKDFLEYCTSILGLIASGSERSVFRDWTKITEDEYNLKEGNLLYCLDFGDVVANALIEIKLDGEYRHYKEKIYIPDNEMPIVQAMEKVNIRKDIVIIADSASPNQIAKIRAAGYTIRAVNKGHDANIEALKSIRNCKVTCCGENIWNEYLNYKYEENKTGELLKDEVPKKGNDHSMDAIKYGEIGKRYANH